MAFKGTPTRTAQAIAEEIEDVGGYINAYTGKEMTAYYARVLEADVERALGILADIVLNPLFDEPDIEVERGVILQEIGQALDTPDDIIFDWLQEAAYPGQPFGRTILGPAERVSGFGAAGPRGLRDRALRAGADHPRRRGRGRSRPAARRRRSGSSATSQRRPCAAGAAGALRRRRAARGARPRAGAHGAGLRGPGVREDAAYAAQIYATALGGGMSSRLFQELRERRGLCYTIFAQAGAYDDTGLITLYAGTGAGADPRADRADHRRAAPRRRRPDRGRARAGAGAAQGRDADGAGEPVGAGRAAGADAEHLGPGAGHRRDRRQDRRGDAGAGARLRRGPGRRAPTRRWRCSARSTTRPTARRWRGGWRPEVGVLSFRRSTPPAIETQRMILRLPEMGDHAAWAHAAPRRRELPARLGAELVARPLLAQGLPQPGLLGLAGARGGQGAGALPDPPRGRAADGRDHARQHPPRAVAVGAGRLLDRAGVRAAGPDDARRWRRWCTTPSACSTSAGSRRPACRRTSPRARCSSARASGTRAWPRATCRSAAAGATTCSTPTCAPTGAIRPGRTVGGR